MMKTITKEKSAISKRTLLFALVLFFFSFGKLVAQPLSGNYTIGSGGNYGTMAAALADLNTNGVSGPVTMTILPGTYTVTAPILIGNYAGVGFSNPLVFRANNPDSVKFTGLVSGSIISLNQCYYVTLRNISVENTINTGNGTGISIIGSSTTNGGTGCNIKACKVSLPFSSSSYVSCGIQTTISATGYGTNGQCRADSISIDSNIITGGYYAIHLYAPTAIGNLYARDIKVRGNTIIDGKYMGFNFGYMQNGIQILNNTINMASTAFYGIYSLNMYNHHVGNNPHRIINNKVYNSAYGIYMTNLNSLAANPTEIYNNVVVGRAAIYNYGLYITSSATYAANFRIYHNTIKQLNATYGYCLYMTGNNAGNNISVMNNIFALGCTQAGTYFPAYFVTSPTNPTGGQAINNNVYHSVGVNAANKIYRGAAFTAATYNTSTAGGDSSSISVPTFTTTEFDGHLIDACNKRGSAIGSAFVPNDLDGQVRSATEPLCGADEVAGVNDNLMAVALVTPTMPISTGAQDLSVRIKNVGANTVTSFNVAYSLNNGTPVVMAYSGTLLPCTDTVMVFTGTNQITLGTSNAIKVYSYSPNSSADADATNDTIRVTLKTPISGVFTIGTGGNYPTFQAATADLANGVSGPVTFKVLPGAYSGQVILNGPIAGVSAVNTITYDGDTAATRTLSANVASGATFLINNVNYVALRNLSIANTANGSTVIGIVGSTANNSGTGCSVVKCILTLNPIQTTSYGINVTGTAGAYGQTANNADSITIDSNTITNAYYGISLYGNTSAPSVLFNRNHRIRFNSINNVYYMGMYLYYIYNKVDVLNNTIIFPNPSTMGYGIYSFYCNNPTGTTTLIANNRVEGAAYGGIYWYSLGTGAIDIFNNVTGRSNYAYTYGMYLYANSSSNVRVLHNTFTVDFAQAGASYGPMVAYLPSNSIVKNNIFACTATTGTQTPLYLYSAPLAASNGVNYNLYWNAATDATIYRGSAFTSATYKTVAAGGDSSFFADPKFVSASNYAVTTCYNGVDLTSITPTDILNVTRNVPSKIGAYENTTPISYVSSSAVQMIGLVAPGATDFPVMRLRVAMQGCGTGYTTNLRFNTIGTTTPANIVAAKLYSTGIGATFNTTKLLGTVFSPSGAFNFVVSDTVNRDLGDTVNYWLAYDVSATAANNNLLDARIDSINILGGFRVPTNNNPTGALTVALPMTYVSSTANHPVVTYVTPGATNAQILRINIETSATGSPIAATTFNLNTTGGGLDTLNIANAKLYYTGNSSTFATTNLVGSYSVVAPTAAVWPAYQITGSQQLVNGTNYFWLAYDMKAGAVLGDSIDAEVTAITIAGVSQTPSVTAPVGYRKIRADYCVSAATSPADEEIWNVTFGSLNNTSTCTTTGGPGSTLSLYSNYSATVAAPNIPAGIATPLSINTGSCGGNYGSFLVVYIDYNQDGDFIDVGELAYSSGAFTGSTAGILKTGTITVPCTALSGETRMRVIYVETGTAPASCGTYTWGETEDYTINIVNGPAIFTSTTAIQITGSTSAGATDVPVLRVPVKVTASPCNPGVINNMRFNTSGTTAVANIVSAKLYKTGNASAFNTNNLVGTIFAPSGQMEFIIADTAVNDTNNYWLAYDISATAPNANVLDARFDSIQAFGSFYLPVNGNPTGNRVISVPMTYVSSTSVHTDLSTVQPSSTANRMLRMMVRTGSTGAPIALTQFSLNTNGGGNDTMNIANAKVFYTGASANFAATTQFGTTYTVTGATTATWPSYQINGNQPLLNDTNYFWLTYDIKAGAVLLDSVDAEVTGMVIAGISQTPTVTAPAGSRRIRQAYCVSSATTAFDGEIFNVTAGNLNNTSSCTTTGGAGSTLSQYSDYTTTVAPADFYVGAPTSINIHAATCGGQYNGVAGAWIDYNQDGDFTDLGETVFMSTSFLYGVGIYVGGSFTVPATATLGNTRMRVTLWEGGTPPISSCGTYGYGETEDYLVNILPAVGGSFVWNGTVSTNATVPANWTPARNSASPYDKLIFNSTTPISVTNVPSTNLGVVTLTPATVVTFAGAAGNVIAVRDSMNLGTGSRLNTGTLIAQLGWDTVNIGSLNGTGRINGNLNRYFNSTLTSIDFPFTNTTNANRTASIAYTTFPVNSGLLSGSFVNATPGNAGLPLTDLSAAITANRAGINGYWTMNTSVTGGTYTATYTGGAFTGVNAYLGLLLLRRADAVSSWSLSGTHVTTTGSNALPVLSRSGLTVYGEFAMGGDTISNPLPVNMLFFAAKNIDGNVQLNWATANEINNKGFGIERSINGVDFTELSFVKGNGTVNKNVNYALLDKRAFELTVSSQLYYRLRQEDFDGSVDYSATVMVNEDDFSTNSVEVYPNPFVNTVGVKFVSASDVTANVEITDMQGRVISTEKVKVNAGNFYHQMASVENMSNGVYFVSVTINGVKQTTKVVKTN
jgi:hypothetical protein